MSKVQFHLTDIPRALYEQLELDASIKETSPANVIAECLCRRYKIKFEKTYSRPDKRSETSKHVRANGYSIGLNMNLRLPLAVVEKLRAQSARTGTSQRSLVLNALAKDLGVKIPRPRNARHGRPRGRKVAA